MTDINFYVINLLNDDILSKIKTFTIQEILELITCASSALKYDTLMIFKDSKLKSQYENIVSNDLKDILINKLQESELYCAFDDNTKSPVDLNGRTFIFSNMEYITSFLVFMKNNYNRDTYSICKIDSNRASKFLYSLVELKGIKEIVVDNGHNTVIINSEYVKMESPYKDEKDIRNPKFYNALAKYLQEIKWSATYENKTKIENQLKFDLYKELVYTTFLVPVKGMNSIAQSIVSGRPISLEFATITDSNGKTFSPVFTDWEEFYKTYDKNEWSGYEWKLEDLVKAPGHEIVINCATLGSIFTKDTIKEVLNHFKR